MTPRTKSARSLPRYIESWEGHHTTELFEKYPLALVSPHPRFSFHCHYDNHTDWLDDIRDPPHQEGRLRLVARPPEARRTRTRAASATATSCACTTTAAPCSACAVVTERVRPGIVHSYASSAKYDPIEPGKSYLDRQGRVREYPDLVTDASASTRRA